MSDEENILVLDVESSTHAKGNPYHQDNVLAVVDLYDGIVHHTFDVEYGGLPYKNALIEIKNLIEKASLLIGFNIKFDLHWIRKYIPDIKFPPVWDCQLGEFILSYQQGSYPGLAECCAKYGISGKLDIVRTEYWERGIDTLDIPRDVLIPYLQQDTNATKTLYDKQRTLGLGDNPLFRMQCIDLIILQEMEFNGMLFDEQAAAVEAERCEKELEAIDASLTTLGPPGVTINWSSSDHLSVVLYGGFILERCRVETARVLKDGSVKVGSKWGLKKIVLPQSVKPPKNRECVQTKGMDDFEIERDNIRREMEGKKPIQRIYSVDEETLKSISPKGKAKRIVDLLLRRAEYKKLLTTYFRGIPEIIQTYGWPTNTLHGQFNQCVVRTGRLSSSKPNLQNQSKQVKFLFKSRFNE